MLNLTPSLIRASFVNASKKEASSVTFPPGIDSVEWRNLELFGWRDPKLPLRAYVVIPTSESHVSAYLLTRGSTAAHTRAQCSWCQDVNLPNPVVLYSAKRPKRAGRNYASVGILVCQDFQCSRNARTVLPMDYEGFSVEEIRQRQIDRLQERVSAFAANVNGK